MVKVQSASEVLAPIAKQLQEAGIASFTLDARLLLGLALDRDEGVLPHENIRMTQDTEQRLEDYLKRRLGGEPISRLRGFREFYGLDFAINEAVLDPRPDSEVLIEAASAWLKKHDKSNPIILDLGTGSGCLILALLYHHPNAQGIATDISKEALEIARQNANALGLAERVKFLHADWSIERNFSADLILANPPYIMCSDIETLAPEVKFYDPHIALDGGGDGLEHYRKILPLIAPSLNANGAAFIEIGKGQGEAITALAEAHHLEIKQRFTDLAKIERCLYLAKK